MGGAACDFTMSSKLLADIASFKQKGSLKPADTHVTTAGGIKVRGSLQIKSTTKQSTAST